MFETLLNLFLSPDRRVRYAIAEFDRIRKELGRAQDKALVQIAKNGDSVAKVAAVLSIQINNSTNTNCQQQQLTSPSQ